MGNYFDLIAAINAAIKTNGEQGITGASLNAILRDMVAALGAGYQYVGVVAPDAAAPSTDYNAVYLGLTAGTYTNFGGTQVRGGQFGVFTFNGSWTYNVADIASGTFVRCDGEQELTEGEKENARNNIDAASNDDVSQLGQKVVSEKTRNIFLLDGFEGKEGLTVSGNMISGKASAFHTNFGTIAKKYTSFSKQIEATTQYMFSCRAYTDGESSSTGIGLEIKIVYTDDSLLVKNFSNSATTPIYLSVVTSASKTIAGIIFSYNSVPGNTWHIYDIQLEKGNVVTSYVPPYTAADYTARDNIEAMQAANIKNWVLSESFTISSATYSGGVVSYASIVWPDTKTGTISITRDSDGNATSIAATYQGATYTVSVVRDSDGNVTSTSIIKS